MINFTESCWLAPSARTLRKTCQNTGSSGLYFSVEGQNLLWENMDQKKSVFWHILRSGNYDGVFEFPILKIM